jgi:hypothetical protein
MLEIEIVECNIIEGGIEVFARAWRDGVQIGFGNDGTVDIERFRIFNPPIMVEDPNGTHERVVESKIDGSISSVFYREDPEQALLQTLSDTIIAVGKTGTNIIAGKVGNTVSTLYPAAGANSPVDGYTGYSPSTTTFSSLIAGNTATDFSATAGSADCIIRTSTTSNQFNRLYKAHFCFDTSVVGTDEISSAILSVYSNTGNSNSNLSQSVVIVSTSLASTDDIAAGDLDATGTTALSGTVSGATWDGSAQYHDFTLNASGLSAINKTGISQFAMVFEDVRSGTFTGTWGSNVTAASQGYSADTAGTTNDPKLVVTHAAVASAFTPRVSFIM